MSHSKLNIETGEAYDLASKGMVRSLLLLLKESLIEAKVSPRKQRQICESFCVALCDHLDDSPPLPQACPVCSGTGKCYCIRKGSGATTGCIRCNESGAALQRDRDLAGLLNSSDNGKSIWQLSQLTDEP